MTDERPPPAGIRSRDTQRPLPAEHSDRGTSGDAASALWYLSLASKRLAESLDYETTLLRVTGMALPLLGSWCIVDVIESDGSMRRLGIVHPNPDRQEIVRRLGASWPPTRNDPLGLPRVAESRQTEIIPDVPDEMLVEVARNDENLRDLRALGIGSVVTVPLIARESILGAITFVSAEEERRYTSADLHLAEDLAARCAIAIDNARLYRAAEVARERMDDVRNHVVRMNEQLVMSSVREQELAEEARDATRAKSLFLATMSHEIRTPINSIVGYSDLLAAEVAGPLTSKQKHYLTRIVTSAEHLIGLIDDILDLAKVEAGRMVVEREFLSASEVASAAIDVVEPQAAVAEVSLESACPDESLMYLGDESRVRQILLILLSNALKFTGRGGKVTISCGRLEPGEADTNVRSEGQWTFIRVEDTGRGISEAEADKVFEPFVQVDDGSARTGGGTGLGLSIGRELARRMGGDLTLRSELGKGSAFTLWLPGADGAGEMAKAAD